MNWRFWACSTANTLTAPPPREEVRPALEESTKLLVNVQLENVITEFAVVGMKPVAAMYTAPPRWAELLVKMTLVKVAVELSNATAPPVLVSVPVVLQLVKMQLVKEDPMESVMEIAPPALAAWASVKEQPLAVTLPSLCT